jgi:hypothetical protein
MEMQSVTASFAESSIASVISGSIPRTAPYKIPKTSIPAHN